jgi:hypothetical protein
MVQPNPWPLPEPWLLPEFFHGSSGQENLLLLPLIMALELVLLPYLRGKCLALAERGRVVDKHANARKRKELMALPVVVLETSICFDLMCRYEARVRMNVYANGVYVVRWSQ